MRGYTRPPAPGGSFREKKFQEQTSIVQYNRTVFFTQNPISNEAVAETNLCVYPVPGKLLSGSGESLRFSFLGRITPDADLKTVKLKLGSTTLLSYILSWDTINLGPGWFISGEIFSLSRTNTTQFAICRLEGEGWGMPVAINRLTSPLEDLNVGADLKITGTCISASGINCVLGKVELIGTAR